MILKNRKIRTGRKKLCPGFCPLSPSSARRGGKLVADVAEVPAAGETLYKGGDMARGITSCVACHGPDAKGMEAAGFPALAGQHANYIKIQLTKFRDTNRHNDLNGMMQDVAKKLSDADIEALSKYISSIK